MAFSAEYIYRILDQYSRPLNLITKSTQRFKFTADASIRTLNRLGSQFEKLPTNMRNFKRTVGSPVFQSQLVNLKDTTRGIAHNINKMGDASRKFSIQSKGLRAAAFTTGMPAAFTTGMPAPLAVAKPVSKVRGKTAQRMGQRLKGMGGAMAGFSAAVGSAAITAGLFKFTVAASDLNDAMLDVSRVTGLEGPALDTLRVSLQKMGRQTGRNALGLAAMAYEGGKLGIANEDMLDFVQTVVKTATAFDMADSEAGRALGSIRAKLGLSMASVDELMQRVNYLADNTSANGGQMIEIIERTSGTFKTLNIPPEVTAGWAAFADQVTVSPQLAASGLNMMMKRMMKMPGMLKKMLADPKNAVKDFLSKFAAIPEAVRGEAILKTFGEEAGTFVMQAVANADLLEKAMNTAASTKALGSMDREFANILARSSTAAKRLKMVFLDISRAIGRVFLKVWDKYSARLISGAEWILKFTKAHPGLIKIVGIISVLAVAITAVVVPLGILASMIGAALPVITAIAGAFTTVVLPVAAIIAALTAWGILFSAMLTKSAMFRQSLLNLLDAFSPIIELSKQAIMLIGKGLAIAFGQSGDSVKSYADAISFLIDGIAALISVLVKFSTWIPRLIINNFEPILETFELIKQGILGLVEVQAKLYQGDFAGAYESMKEKIGKGIEVAKTVIWDGFKDNIGSTAANEKAKARQDNKMEVSGQIGVTASEGAKVQKAEINLNQGYNIAAMGM